MFWILRRTGAANFFTSINNNYSSKSHTNNNNSYDKNSQRPPRKAYGRLSVDSDENCNRTTNSSNRPKYNNPFDELDNFDILDDSAKCSPNDNCNSNSATQERNDNDSDIELDSASSKSNSNERHESTINRLQAMVISDDDDYDESLTCNVCDRAFHCHRQLASHQQKKRHFGCSGCDTLFPSLMLLEHHKEEFEHWSDEDDDDRLPPCCRRNRDEYTDTDSFTSEAESEDLERLL
ncbi:putative uncharacterized protein DDB_G0282133 [Sitodiplosis mosellana]|uniref:putative uncharacterized protein DDB_G0282133 n=1 Tax=Sitodiplosis mosellana TaxID=263140 RepID=UPI002443AA65|nr:putative uncharacterized protein DDB_G0282133 [Sitodiplosis mosellana]